MMDLVPAFVELIRRAATDLPAAVETRLQAALEAEEHGSAARLALETMLHNARIAREKSTPICQDTGTPGFYLKLPESMDAGEVQWQVRAAVAQATQNGYLRPNAVDPLTGEVSGNTPDDAYFPYIHIRTEETTALVADLILKGGGCENVSAQYSLPDERLAAGRDLDGVWRCALDAVQRAQGQGCAPGFIGVAYGGDRQAGYAVAKEALLRRPDEVNRDETLAGLEGRITTDANRLGIGPMGFGGKTTLLGTKVVCASSLPASRFVTVSYMCWAYRYCRMTVEDGRIRYE